MLSKTSNCKNIKLISCNIVICLSDPRLEFALQIPEEKIFSSKRSSEVGHQASQ